jgi:hypothetical protein
MEKEGFVWRWGGVIVRDESAKLRTNTTDGLGRLLTVAEDPSGLNYTTLYTYDTLDNLLTVAQGTQTRTFSCLQR